MAEEGKVVSFLKGFTDIAFAGHLLRTVQANTLGTATEVALVKEAEQKREHWVMDEEHLGANKRTQAVLWTTHTDALKMVNLNPNHCAKNNCRDVVNSRLANLRMLQRGRPLRQGATNSSTITILYIAGYCWRAGPCPTRYLCCQITHGWKIYI